MSCNVVQDFDVKRCITVMEIRIWETFTITTYTLSSYYVYYCQYYTLQEERLLVFTFNPTGQCGCLRDLLSSNYNHFATFAQTIIGNLHKLLK